tara:strand:+ start:152 stop:739 length:588 start_codon:yes stop_codon:yes gene_type:complete
MYHPSADNPQLPRLLPPFKLKGYSLEICQHQAFSGAMSLLREEDGVELGEKATGHKETAAAGRPVLLDHGFIGTAKQNEVSVRIADIQVPTALRTPGGSYAFASLPEKLTREVEEERDGDEDRPSDEEETEDEMDLDSLHSFMVVLPPAVDRSNEVANNSILLLSIAYCKLLLSPSKHAPYICVTRRCVPCLRFL